MICYYCGNNLPDGQEFCDKCGKRVSLGRNFCKNCGVEIVVGHDYCQRCGQSVYGNLPQPTFYAQPNFNPPVSPEPTYEPADKIAERAKKRELKKRKDTPGKFLSVLSVLLGIILTIGILGFNQAYSVKNGLSDSNIRKMVLLSDLGGLDASIFTDEQETYRLDEYLSYFFLREISDDVISKERKVEVVNSVINRVDFRIFISDEINRAKAYLLYDDAKYSLDRASLLEYLSTDYAILNVAIQKGISSDDVSEFNKEIKNIKKSVKIGINTIYICSIIVMLVCAISILIIWIKKRYKAMTFIGMSVLIAGIISIAERIIAGIVFNKYLSSYESFAKYAFGTLLIISISEAVIGVIMFVIGKVNYRKLRKKLMM